jgi:nifR3 family TIM-barrel protein
MGCPVRKVVTKGGGSALLREPKKLASFFSTIKKNLSIPLSIKIRTGWDETNINADEIINVAHNEGIEFVAIHGRTRTQQYKGKADWNYLEKISSNSPLPVIGNGDLNAKNDIIRRLHTTHCQALMIGRAALRNPFIFLEGIQEEGDETTFSAQDIFEVSERLFSHLRNTVDRERVLLVQMRKHLIWLAAGYKNVSHFRNELFRTDNIEDIQQISQEYFLSLGPAQKSIKDSQSFMMGGHG